MFYRCVEDVITVLAWYGVSWTGSQGLGVTRPQPKNVVELRRNCTQLGYNWLENVAHLRAIQASISQRIQPTSPISFTDDARSLLPSFGDFGNIKPIQSNGQATSANRQESRHGGIK
jgi:hypothetical protein